MTQPVQEPSAQRADANLSWGERQLRRRPSPFTGGRFVCLIFSGLEAVTVENDAAGFFLVIPEDLGGADLTHVAAAVRTVASSGTTTVQIRNFTQTADMLTTRITIDSGEFTSYTAAVPPVIDTANDDVATGNLIVVDVDVAGTGAMGLDVVLHFG